MAKQKVKIKGLAKVNTALRQLERKMKANVRPALTEVTALIQKESMNRTPIRTGNLRASHRSAVIRRGLSGWYGVVYLTANYALFVHEAPPSTKFRSPWPRGRKYLERAIVDNLTRIVNIIRRWESV